MLTVALSLFLAITPAITRGPAGNMVVWEQDSRIYANEVLVAPESSSAQSTPDVAAFGDFFFVVWREGLRAYGRILYDGRPLGPITDLGDAYQQPSVAADHEGFVVALQQQRGINILHVSEIGFVTREEPMSTSYLTPPPGPAVACNGANCATVWLESIAPNGCTVHSCNIVAEVRAKRLDGQPVDIASVSPGVNRLAIAVKPNGDFAVAWSDDATTSFALIEGDRVIRSGAALFGTRPSIDFDGVSFIAARNAGDDVIGTRIGSEGDFSDFVIATSDAAERNADVAMPFVVYEQEGRVIVRDLTSPFRRRTERIR
ncbi:MAG TPA: hypothetical protein VII75_02990 [Thermoanaerobaculia bacterium]|nr:hypothetical protein [Thermoanaerobaculia bacterium]